MKERLLILMGLFICGCADTYNPAGFEKIEYIDYSNCSGENLTHIDSVLLESISFDFGRLSTSFDVKEAKQRGIPEEKYEYFIEYLQNENQRIEKYLSSGAIVFYNGEPFTSNEEMWQYVEMPNENLSRAAYYDSVALVTRSSAIISGSTTITETFLRFNAPHFIDIRMDGSGTIQLIEEGKGFEAYLIHTTGMEGAKFVWGAGDNVSWNWKVRYLIGSGYTAYLYVYGHWCIPFPGIPGSDTGGATVGGIGGNIYDPNNPIYTSRFPSAVRYTLLEEKRAIEITVNANGKFQMQVYRVMNGTSSLFTGIDNCNGYTTYTLACPIGIQYRVLINKEVSVNGKKSYQYYGDKMFPPLL